MGVLKGLEKDFNKLNKKTGDSNLQSIFSSLFASVKNAADFNGKKILPQGQVKKALPKRANKLVGDAVKNLAAANPKIAEVTENKEFQEGFKNLKKSLTNLLKETAP